MKFATFGPYDVTTWDQMSALFKERGEPALEHAAGIYIFFQEIGDRLVPLYVGQTRTHFGERVASHMNREITEAFKHHKKKAIRALFIALITPSGRLKRKPSKADERTLDKLEFMLIGASWLKNPKLHNRQHKRFYESLSVPGYVNNELNELHAAGRCLHELLR